MAWLDSVNQERERRGASRLQRCVLSAHGDVFRVPWEDVVHPQFVNRPPTSHQQGERALEDGGTPSSSCNDGRLLPFPTQPGQSAVRTDDEESEGEYVELTELPPLPRFSPQKGSLTQSISERHRTRTSNLHSQSNNTHSGVTGVGSHHRSKVTEEAPPTTPAGSDRCSPHEGKEEDEEVGGDEKDADSRRHKSLEPECGEKEERLQVEAKSRSREEEEEEEQRDEATSQEELQRQGTKQEEMKVDQKEEENETGCEDYIDIDFYSEMNKQLKHSEDSYSESLMEKLNPEENMTEDAQRKYFYCGKYKLEDSYSQTNGGNSFCEGFGGNAHTVSSYSEKLTRTANLKDFYLKSITEGIKLEDFSENMSQTRTDTEDFQCKSITDREPTTECYFENITQTSKPKSSVSVNKKQINTEIPLDTQSEDSYFEIASLQKPTNEFERLNSHAASEDVENPKSQDSCSENVIQQKPPEDSYCENPTQTQPEDFFSQHKIQPEEFFLKNPTPLKDSYSESQTQPMGSYFENPTLPADCYFESPIQTHPKDSFSENPTQPKNSYCENTTQTLPDYSYSKKPTQTLPEDSYSESTTQTLPDDAHSEKPTQTLPEDSCSENPTETLPDDIYSENQIQPKEMYSENPPQTLPVDSYSENPTQTLPEDSYSEKPTQRLLEDSYYEDPTVSERHQTGQESDEEEELSCEEAAVLAGRRSADHLTEGASWGPPVHLGFIAGSNPVELEQPLPPQTSQCSQSRLQSELLTSGAVCLPGTRDRGGRALLTVSTSNPIWLNPDCDGNQLLRLVLYYASTLSAEARAAGVTVLVDARGASPGSAVISALRSLQEDSPGSIHRVLILANRDAALHPETAAAPQVEVLSSLKSLQKHVELQQLPAEFGGLLSFSQSSWISFRLKVEQLTKQCSAVIDLLGETISRLQSSPLPEAAEDAELLLHTYRAAMDSTLKDARLVRLQQEGGASLAWLRREEASGAWTAPVEAVGSLYDQVDELLHRLVTLSNSRTQELSFILDFRGLEQGFSQVRAWLEQEGEARLKTLNEPVDSLELVNRKLQDFRDFYVTAYERFKQGEALLARLERWGDVSSLDLHDYEVKVHSFWAQIQDFSQRVKGTGQNIERAVRLYGFLDQAYAWALDGMRRLAGVSMKDCMLPDKGRAVIGCLEEYRSKHPPIPDSRFQEMKAEAGQLRGERGLRQWSFAWSKCQETKGIFDRKMEAALRTRDSAHRRRSDSITSTSSASSRRSGLWGIRETSVPPEEDAGPSPQRTSFLRRLLRSSSSSEQSDSRLNPSHAPSTPSFPSSPPRRQQLRKTQSFDCPPTPDAPRWGACPRTLSEPPGRGNTGVFIRGLEVSSAEAADRTLHPRTPAQGWAGPRSPGVPAAEGGTRGSKLRHIVEEMVTTEREYVRSLRYVIHHYFPEMERADLPQDLSGKRAVVFGNLDQLLDFHSQFFLSELEACWKHPLRVPHCFLRHQEQFGLYALYSKNKPKSDALLANHGHAFFRWKQLELGDKMDLSSYLLKPIQRMSKYALLLSDLIKEVGGAQEAELTALQDATNMVKFQLRHGNDLLAMDAIRECDVNLKEPGQLIRQDEFTVWSGRRKCQRRIFLFQDLVLFSKPKRMEGGLDVFIYKQSFKTADVGLTESSGDDGLRFEIWFRRRTAKNQTFVLQAAAPETKHAWTAAIAAILWSQASRNKELRLKEMLSMGVGNKPFLDIQPSDAAISDRAVHGTMKARGARTRASIAVSAFDHAHPFRGGAPPDGAASGPSSSSLLGPLNLHMFSQLLPYTPPGDASFSSSCIEEDEQEHETSSQPSMTTDSSGSSRCLSCSTSSDSGAVSARLQEAPQEEAGPPSSSSSSGRAPHQGGGFVPPEGATVV